MNKTRRLILTLILLLLAAMPAIAGIKPTPGSHSLVISQFFLGNGSATTSPYAASYVEIFNAGSQTVDLQDWTLIYSSSTSTTAAFGDSNKQWIGSIDPISTYCAAGCQIVYSPTFANSANCTAAQAGQYTPHCVLNPGQYLLIKVKASSTAGTMNQPLPITPDLDLSAQGDPATTSTTILSPSATSGKLALTNSHSSAPSCNYVGTSPIYGLPVPPTAFSPTTVDLVGYGSSAPNCWEGTSATQPSFLINASDYSNGYADFVSSTLKNKSAMVRVNGFAGPHTITTPTNMAETPCADTDNNAANFAPVQVGNAVAEGGTAGKEGSAAWILHNSYQSYDITNHVQTYTPTPCANVANTVVPTVETQATPSEVEANTTSGTPVTLTVTVTDGGSNPTSAIFNMTADLTVVGGSKTQKLGYLGQDALGYPQYSFALTINPPLTDVGKTYSIPITVTDDAYRTANATVSIKVVTNTPGQASVSVYPASIVETIATPVTVTATITDPGAYPTGVSFTGTADLSSVGGAIVPLVAGGTDASGHLQLSAQVTVTAPQRGTFTIPVTITDDQSRTLTITPSTLQLTVTAAGPIASLSTSSLDFGGQNLGSTSSSKTVTLSNTGTANLVISGISASGDFSQTNQCPAQLPVNQSCQITVAFTPTQAGTRTGALTISDNADGSPHVVSLSGLGVAVPTANITPGSLDFGSLILSTSSTGKTITLNNTGTAALSIYNIAITGDFAETTTCKGSLAFNSSCTIMVTFTPTAAGSRTGTLTITDNTNNVVGSQQTVTLTGTGTDFPVVPATGGSMTQSVAAGQPATYNLQVSPAGGFSGTVAFTCAGAPQSATCTVTPASLNVAGAVAAFTVSVTTKSRPTQTAQLNLQAPVVVGSQSGPGSGGPSLPATVVSFLALAIGGLFASSKKVRQQWRVAAVSCALLCVIGMTACAGLKTQPWPATPVPGTPAGAYTITVTATSGTVTHTMPLTLNVN